LLDDTAIPSQSINIKLFAKKIYADYTGKRILKQEKFIRLRHIKVC